MSSFPTRTVKEKAKLDGLEHLPEERQTEVFNTAIQYVPEG